MKCISIPISPLDYLCSWFDKSHVFHFIYNTFNEGSPLAEADLQGVLHIKTVTTVDNIKNRLGTLILAGRSLRTEQK